MTRQIFIASVLLAACSDDSSPGPGVIELQVSADSADGSYERRGALFELSILTVEGEHRLVIVDDAGTTVIAVAAPAESLGDAYLDWSAMDAADEDDLARYRGVFADLATAARHWGRAEGTGAPSWLVPLLQTPNRLVPSETGTIDEGIEPELPPPGGVNP
jgi:hypothetical protein